MQLALEYFETLRSLGHCARLQFRQAWLEILDSELAKHPLSQNEFLLMLADDFHTAATKQLVILRVEDWDTSNLAHGKGLQLQLRCAILGSFYQNADTDGVWHFVNQISLDKPANGFRVYAPSEKILSGLVNGTLNTQGQLDLGLLRYNEQGNWTERAVSTRISMQDIVTKRTAMLGKTRLGKSNVVKLIAQGMLDYTQHTHNVGQLLFDVSGEYSNTNPGPGEITLASHNPGRCTAYFLTERQGNKDGRLLRFNFFQSPGQALDVIRELLPPHVSDSEQVRGLLTCRLSDLMFDSSDSDNFKYKQLRKVMLFWAILDAGGFAYDNELIRSWLTSLGFSNPFNPGFSSGLRQAAYQAIQNTPSPAMPNTMAAMLYEINTIAKFRQIYSNDPHLIVSGRPVFDSEEAILLNFLFGDQNFAHVQGPFQLRTCLPYHSPFAEDFIVQILTSLNEGRTVIIDLSNAGDRVVRYFAQKLCLAIFSEQEHKFKLNTLTGRYIQIYFEEAHTIFPLQDTAMTHVYARFAKEGAKFHIGIAYATQSPTTINPDLLAQTENFFIGHLSSQKEVDCLCELQVAFKGCENAIRFNRTPGLIQALTQSHRYVIPMQAHLYEGKPLLC